MDPLPEAELCFPELLNASCYNPQLPPTQQAVFSSIIWCVSVLTVSLNLLVIISISHYRQLHTTTNLLILSLGVTDLMVGLMMPVVFYAFTSCWTLGPYICALYVFFYISPLSTSTGNMVLISVDRYVAICDPLHYYTKVTVTRVQFCIIMCWAGLLFYNVVFIMVGITDGLYICHGECIGPMNVVSVHVDNAFSYLVPIVIIVMYSRVFVVAVSQARAYRSNTVVSGNITVRRSELKAARTLGVVVLVFLLCYSCYFLSPITGQHAASVLLCMYANSFFNPLIYALFYPWFRKTFKLILTLQILQTDSSKTSIL